MLFKIVSHHAIVDLFNLSIPRILTHKETSSAKFLLKNPIQKPVTCV